MSTLDPYPKKIKTVELLQLLQTAKRTQGFEQIAVSVMSYMTSRALMWEEWILLPDAIRPMYTKMKKHLSP